MWSRQPSLGDPIPSSLLADHPINNNGARDKGIRETDGGDVHGTVSGADGAGGSDHNTDNSDDDSGSTDWKDRDKAAAAHKNHQQTGSPDNPGKHTSWSLQANSSHSIYEKGERNEHVRFLYRLC